MVAKDIVICSRQMQTIFSIHMLKTAANHVYIYIHQADANCIQQTYVETVANHIQQLC
jgi:hypothetical protein